MINETDKALEQWEQLINQYNYEFDNYVKTWQASTLHTSKETLKEYNEEGRKLEEMEKKVWKLDSELKEKYPDLIRDLPPSLSR